MAYGIAHFEASSPRSKLHQGPLGRLRSGLGPWLLPVAFDTNRFRQWTTVACTVMLLALVSTPLAAASQGQDSIIDRLERMEATINTINSDVEGIIKSQSSASLNAAVCISTGVGTALTLQGDGEAGARWDVAALGDIHGELSLGITGDSTMAADVCIDVPLMSIAETSIPTDESNLKLVSEDGAEVVLTADETNAFKDSLIEASSELQDMGLAMGGSMAELMDQLNPAQVLSPTDSPLLDPAEIVGAVPDVLLTGSVVSTPFAALPMASDVEATMKSFVKEMEPCNLMQNSAFTSAQELDEVVSLVCNRQLLTHLDVIDDIWGTVEDIWSLAKKIKNALP